MGVEVGVSKGLNTDANILHALALGVISDMKLKHNV